MKTLAAIAAVAALLLGLHGPAQAKTASSHAKRHARMTARHSSRRHYRMARRASAVPLHVTRTARTIRITGRSAAPPPGTSNVTLNTSSTGSGSINDASRDNGRQGAGNAVPGAGDTNSVSITHRRHSVTPPAVITNNGQSPAGTGQ